MIDHDQIEVLSYLTDEGLAIRAEVERIITAATLLAEIERRRMHIGLQPLIAGGASTAIVRQWNKHQEGITSRSPSRSVRDLPQMPGMRAEARAFP